MNLPFLPIGTYNEAVRKILMIRNAYSFDFGGGERVPIDLANELRSLGHAPVIVSRSPKLLEYARYKNLPTVKGWWWSFQDWSGKFLLFSPFYFVWQLLLMIWYVQLIIQKHIDVVHPQSRDDFIAATLAGILLRKRIIWTDHADLKYVYRNGSIWYKNPIGKVIYWLSKQVRAVILVSENEKRHIQDSLGHKVPDNYKVIYNGVSSSKTIPIARTAADKGKVIFAATSRLVVAKGIGELIKAFQVVSMKHANTCLWLFGEGPDEKKFKDMAVDNNHIIFWGFPVDSLERLADCDVFVHPSYHEGFSLSLVEAAKLGLPIIACDVGGNPELVTDGKNGLLIPAKDVQALATAMEKLVSNPRLRRQYGQAARTSYKTKLVFEKIVKESFVPLYEK